jgi:PAS domain S-box-containing protein
VSADDQAQREPAPPDERAFLSDPTAIGAALLSGSREAILVADPAGRITFFNAAAERLFRHRAEQAVGAPVAMLVPPERAGEQRRLLDQALRGIHVEVHATERLRADGSRIAVSLAASPLRTPDGAVAGVAVVVREPVRDRSGDERMTLLASLVDASADAIVGVSGDLRILSWNRGAEQVFGLTARQAIGADVSAVLLLDPDEARGRARSLRRVLEEGATLCYDVERTRVDGRAIALDVTASPVRQDDGEIVAACVVARDVTERAELQSRLRRAERLEAIGRLAGGIAHDFNNVLTVISGYLDLAVSRAGVGPLRDDLREVERAAERAADLTRRLLDFSRHRPLVPTELDLNAQVSGIVAMLHRVLGRGIDVVLLTGDGVPSVVADRSQIEQVVMNLVLNARDAMPAGGTLTIETRTEDVSEGRFARASRRHACLTVTDTGVGIDPALVEQLFEPLVTTKDERHGTGLGLATVASIVDGCGGFVRVQSAPGEGAAFSVFLPAVEGEAPRRTPTAAPRPARAPRRPTLLVCEADAEVCAFIARVAGDDLELLTSQGEDEALRRLRAGTMADALLVDTSSLATTPAALLERLDRDGHDLPVLWLCGYAAGNGGGPVVVPPGEQHVEKPFTAEALLGAIGEVLGRRPRRRPSRSR